MTEIEQARGARAVLEVDLAAIRHNLAELQASSGGAKVMAVLKGDAYGMGACVLAPFVEACGVSALAVDNVAEGIALRDAGVRGPIMVIDGDLPDNAAAAIAHGLIPGIAQEELLDAYERAAAAAMPPRRHPIWLVANVGFNRSGYRDPAPFVRFLERVRDSAHLDARCVYAHLTSSNAEADVSLAQLAEYQRAVASARAVLGRPIETSVFASHGQLRWASAHRSDWVRPGVLLYGEHNLREEHIEPDALARARSFRRAIRLRARVLHVLEFHRAEAVGYGQHHRTRPGQRLATVAIGFGSGYPFGARPLHALVHGQRAPLFGAVGMDALQIDVTEIPAVRPYDWITLIGAEGNEEISVHALARAAEMSTYELMSRLTVQRMFIDPEGRSP